MNKTILTFSAILFSFFAHSQIVINGNDITKETEMFDVWAIAKPFSSKESYFVDYGQDKFKPHYYDHKTQAIYTKDNVKIEKGEWMKLVKYLESQGYTEKSSRDGNVGEQKGRIITFVKKQE